MHGRLCIKTQPPPPRKGRQGLLLAFRAGDNVKTGQQNAGHYSAAFTLDRYAHITETMRLESANRMQRFIEGLE